MTSMIRQLVEIPGQFKPSVQLPRDFYDAQLNEHFVNGYIPTDDVLDFFVKVKESIQPGNDSARARIVSGTFGTGKSDLMLMLANYVTRDADDPLMQIFYRRLENINVHKAHAVREARHNQPPFLLVVAQADTAMSFSSLILTELQQSLERADRLDLMGQTIYQAAIDLIETWEQKNNANLEQLRVILEEDHQFTILQLKTALESSNADAAYREFTNLFERVVGIRFTPTDAIQRPSDALANIAERIVSSGEYCGIFVICDEFTHLLEKLAQSPSEISSKAIDNVAETATRSAQNQLHFTVVSLRPFSSIQAATQGAQDALEKSGGRFTSSFEMTSKNVEVLIGAAIQRLVSSDELLTNQKQLDELLGVAEHLYKQPMSILETSIIRHCYPLHPITTYMLPRLNARLAQNERTTFRFLWDDELGLSHFINTEPVTIDETNWHNVVPVDYLFGYFESSLDQKRSDLSLAYEEAHRRIPEEQFTGLAGRIVRALILFETLNDNRLAANESFLIQALNIPPEHRKDLENALKYLQEEAIAIPDNKGFYEISKPGRADPRVLRNAVDTEARHSPEQMIGALNANNALPHLVPEQYNQEYKAKRNFYALFTSVNDLASPAWIAEISDKYEALALYVVAASDNERAEAMTLARGITRDNQLILVAVPRRPSNLLETYRKYRALQSLRSRDEYRSEEYLKLLRNDGHVGKGYFNDFNTAYNTFGDPSNFEWYWQGDVASNIQQVMHLNHFASHVMKQVYSKSVTHRQQQHLAQDKLNAAVKSAVDAILQSSITIKTGGKKSASEAVLADGASPLGLIQAAKIDKGFQHYSTAIPTMSPSREIWEVMTRYFNSGSPSLENLFQELQKPPFGLYPPIIALFLAAFYYHNADAIDVFSGSSLIPVAISSEIISNMMTAPKYYRISYRTASEEERHYWRALIERVFFPGKTLAQGYGSSTGSLKTAVVKALKEWSQSTSAIVRGINEKALMQISHLSPEQADIATGLIRLGLNPADVSSIIQGLLVDAPQRLNMPLVLDSNIDEVNGLVDELEKIAGAVVEFDKALAEYILADVAQIWGAVSYSAENREPLFEILVNWREDYGYINPANLTDKYAVSLLYALRGLNSSHALKPALLKDIPKRFDLEPVTEWSNISNFDKLISLIQKAKSFVERQPRPAIEDPSPENSQVPNSFGSIPDSVIDRHSSPATKAAPTAPAISPVGNPTSNAPAKSIPVQPDGNRSKLPTNGATEIPFDPIFPDDLKLERVMRKLLASLKEEGLTVEQRTRLFDELASRYGSR